MKNKTKFKESFINKSRQSIDSIRKLKMTRLIDRWNFRTILAIIVIRILQVLKLIGFKAEENSWRKLTGTLMLTEQSKFILASFRIKYFLENNLPDDAEVAKKILIIRLMGFLRENPDCHWTIEWGYFRAKRKQLFFTDIVEAQFSQEGVLLKLIPCFDDMRQTFNLVKQESIDKAISKLVSVFNETGIKDLRSHRRSKYLHKRLMSWLKKTQGLSHEGKQELRHFIYRIINGTFIQFEILPNSDDSRFDRVRLATPILKYRRHPGFGLLNIICRFTPDLSEADLWMQYHHVPVDGMPMQDMLTKLKQEWGAVGLIKYPCLSSAAARPEIFYFGNKIFRARIFVSFEKIIKLRKYLNEHYFAAMGGSVTFMSLIIWGLSHDDYFKNQKFLIPAVSMNPDFPDENNISLMFIRPCRYFDANNPLKGFLKYQHEFNMRAFSTKMGQSESDEILKLLAMLHPWFFKLCNTLMPKIMGEVSGGAGITMLRDSEMFISPLTSLQLCGFIALGNMRMPTEDGKTAGAISICGSRKQVRKYIQALYDLTDNYYNYLGIKEN